MSRLQAKTRPILTAIQAGESTSLDEDECLLLARWAVTFSMVLGDLHSDLVFSTKEERRLFHTTQVPPVGWQVWMGRYDFGFDPLHNHFGIAESVISSGPSAERTGRGAQSTGWGLAGVYFLTSYRTPGYERVKVRKDVPLPQIWPFSEIVQVPEPTLTEDEIGHLDRFVLGIEPDDDRRHRDRQIRGHNLFDVD